MFSESIYLAFGKPSTDNDRRENLPHLGRKDMARLARGEFFDGWCGECGVNLKAFGSSSLYFCQADHQRRWSERQAYEAGAITNMPDASPFELSAMATVERVIWRSGAATFRGQYEALVAYYAHTQHGLTSAVIDAVRCMRPELARWIEEREESPNAAA